MLLFLNFGLTWNPQGFLTWKPRFSEECRIVSDTYTLHCQVCQNFTSLERLVVSATDGQRWFEKTGWDPNADQISQTKRKKRKKKKGNQKKV